MMRLGIFCISFFVFCLTTSFAVNPGFISSVTQAGLNYAKDVGIEYLKEDVSSINIPDQSGTAHVSVIGDIDWTLSSIVLKGLSFPTSSIATKAGTGVALSVSDMSASITLNWHYKEHSWPHVSGSGSADITVSQTSIAATIGITNVNEKVHATAVSDSVSIGDLDIKVHGGASWLYQLFVDVLKGTIEKAASSAIESAITNSINTNLNAVLETIPNVQPIGDYGVEVDFGLVGDPEFDSNYILAPERGEFYETAKHTEAPFAPPAIPSVTPSMELQIAFSDYVPNTLFLRFYEIGLMKYLITDENLPPGPLKLNTSSWSVWCPPLAKKFPNMDMQIGISADFAPTSKLTEQGVNISGNASVEVYVINATSKAQIPAFILTLDLDALMVVVVNSQMLTGNITETSGTVTLKQSFVGDFDPTSLETLVNFIIKGVALPMFNEELQKGIMLPVIKHVTLVKPTVSYGNGYVGVATNVQYQL